MKLIPNGALKIKPALFLLILAALTGCSSVYIDGTTKEIPSSQYRHTEPLHPVQVLFEFQTKGVSNTTATNFLKENVIEQISASGLFTEVSERPVAGGALLGITLNNVSVDDDAFKKGFVTGFTFGLVGSQVTDGYICAASYTDSRNAQPIVKRARHAIYTTVGASKSPENAIKVTNFDEAAKLMTRQIISNVLNDLSNDTAFK
jgi:hypothetical protein